MSLKKKQGKISCLSEIRKQRMHKKASASIRIVIRGT